MTTFGLISSASLRADDALAVQLAAVGQHQNPPFQAVEVGVQAAAGVAGLADHPPAHGRSCRPSARKAWRRFCPRWCPMPRKYISIPSGSPMRSLSSSSQVLPGQPLTQVAEATYHLVLVAVLLPEAERRREVGDAAHQIRAVPPAQRCASRRGGTDRCGGSPCRAG